MFFGFYLYFVAQNSGLITQRKYKTCLHYEKIEVPYALKLVVQKDALQTKTKVLCNLLNNNYKINDSLGWRDF